MIEVRSYKERLFKQRMLYLATGRKAQSRRSQFNSVLKDYGAYVALAPTWSLSSYKHVCKQKGYVLVLKDIYRETFDNVTGMNFNRSMISAHFAQLSLVLNVHIQSWI